MGKHVYARREFSHEGKMYRPGDELPSVDAKQLAKWQQAGSVYILENGARPERNVEPAAKPTASQGTQPPVREKAEKREEPT